MMDQHSSQRVSTTIYYCNTNYEITYDAEATFIEKLTDALQSGYRFLPLIGAGISAPAGIPVIGQLQTYLQRCICLALGAEDPNAQRWDPRSHQWPPYIDPERPDSIDWEGKVLAELDRRKRTKSEDPELAIIQEGYGAMIEWRSSLQFLSRLTLQKRSEDPHVTKLVLESPNQNVIDACFREVTRNRQPTLAHHMISALSGALGLDLILTTNFDDLIEQAFRASGNGLSVQEISVRNSLPPWGSVSDTRTLLKIHGGRLGLRADYTLDDKPMEEDVHAFMEYVAGKALVRKVTHNADQINVDLSQVRSHVLVLGTSLDDRRTKAYLKKALSTFPDLRVFAICYSERDVKGVAAFAKEVHSHEPDKSEHRFVILRHPNLGLLLLHLYQRLRKTIPTVPGIFPSVSRLAVPPIPRKGDKSSYSNSITEMKQKMSSAISDILERPSVNPFRLLVAHSPIGQWGVTSACSETFWSLEGRYHCIWIDMNNIDSTRHLFETLLETINYKLGLENWLPTFVPSQEVSSWIAELVRVSNLSSKSWIVFLNARERPGSNYDDPAGTPEDAANGWLDQKPRKSSMGEDDPTASPRFFDEFVTKLCTADGCKITMVLACFDKNGAVSAQDPRRIVPSYLGSVHSIELPRGNKKFEPDSIVSKVLRWCLYDSRRKVRRDKLDRRQRLFFVSVLAHFPRSRLLSSIWHPAVLQEGQPNHEEAYKWLDELEAIGLLRFKPGGLIWFRTQCRAGLRKALGDSSALRKVGFNKGDATRIDAEKPDLRVVRRRIADWYVFVFKATGAPPALYDAADQLAEVVHLEVEAAQTVSKAERNPRWLAVKALCNEISALLRDHRHLLEMQGYSKGSCRRISRLRERLRGSSSKMRGSAGPFVAEPELRDTLVVCTALMRGIAREVGELGKALLRQKEIRSILLTGTWRRSPYRPVEGRAWVQIPRGSIYEQNVQLHWYRWCAALATASRSYSDAVYFLGKAWSLAIAIDPKDLELPSNVVDGLRKMGFSGKVKLDVAPSGSAVRTGSIHSTMPPKPGFGDKNQRLTEWLRVQELFVACRLLQVSLLDRRRTTLPVGDGGPHKSMLLMTQRNKYLAEAHQVAMEILGLTGDLPAGQSDDSNQPSPKGSPLLVSIWNEDKAVWARARLLMHLAVARIRSESSVGSGSGFKKAMSETLGLLARAETLLHASSQTRQMTDRGILEIHRAEVVLWAVGSISVKRKVAFREYAADWVNHYLGALNFDRFEPAKRKEIQMVRAMLQDTMRFLDRAQPLLRSHRRNVWWNSWLIERRLRVIGHLVLVSASSPGEPVPYLGLEAACRKSMTEADELLEEALRLIRVDPYRLACIVEAYGVCMLALQFKLDQDENTPRLPDRLRRMTIRLGHALRVLHQVHRRRKEAYENNQNDHKAGRGAMKLDENGAEYIRAVIDNTSRILQRFVVVS